MNIAYILAKNEVDKIQQQEQVKKYCSNQNIKLDDTIVDIANTDRIGRRYILDKLFSNNKQKITNLVLVDINSVGADSSERLIFLRLMKKYNTIIHIMELSIDLNLKNIKLDISIAYPFLQILVIFKEAEEINQ